MSEPSPFRAPRVTTVVAPSGRIHAVDTMGAQTSTVGAIRTVCGGTVRHYVMLRSSATSDAYVTCTRCAARLADGVTVSAASVRRARLASRLASAEAGAR